MKQLSIPTDNVAVKRERELSKRDVCMYCGGRCPEYNRIPEWPNAAGNWVHRNKAVKRYPEGSGALCVASSIFARENYERALKATT